MRALDELALRLAKDLQSRQPRCDNTIAQLPILASPISSDLVPIFHNGQTYAALVSALAAAGPLPLPFANVMGFGAKGDGVTDDTLAIQAAVTSLATSGGTVWFPPGVYIISQPISRASVPMVLAGAGMGASTIRISASIAATVFDNKAMFIDATPSTAVQHSAKDLTFDFNGLNIPTARIPSNAQFLYLPSQSFLTRCEMINRISNPSYSSNFGMFIGGSDIYIAGNYFHQDAFVTNTTATISGTGSQVVTPTSMAGIYVGQLLWIDGVGQTNPELVKVTAVTPGVNFTASYQRSHSGSVSVQGWTVNNDFIGGGTSSPSTPSRGLIVTGNRFENLESDSYQRTNAYNDVITSNTCMNCIQGILVQGGSGTTVANNIIDNSQFGIYPLLSSGAGIWLNNAGTSDQLDVSITGNTINTHVNGIVVSPSANTVRTVAISGNVVDTVLYTGIFVQGYNVNVSANTIRNVSQAGVTITQPGFSVPASGILHGAGSFNSIIGNTIIDERGTPQMGAGISIAAFTSPGIINTNLISGIGAGGVGIDTAVTPTGWRIQDNIGWNPPPVSAITTPAFPASGTPVTNATGYAIHCTIQNGTGAITGLGINGVLSDYGIAASGNGYLKLDPNESIVFTYASGSPAWKWLPA